MKFYLRMEGVNLANFVYDTQDLSTVRGGGLLLLGAVTEVLQNITSVKLFPLNAGASSGIFQFDEIDPVAAERVRNEVEAFLHNHPQLRHATFVVDIQSAGSNFVNDRESLLARNRWRQIRQPSLAAPVWNIQAEIGVCEIDRVRPATRSMPGPEGKIERVSESVQARREFGRNQKQQFYQRETGKGIQRDFAQYFDELSHDPDRGNLHRKIAVIYLDGNSFGKLQNAECTTPEKQQQFDSTVKSYRRKLLKALLKVLENDQGGWVSKHDRYRLETLLWGGDEIIWVVPAWQGWNTLNLFYQQSREWRFEGHPLTHAAGLVFCHHNAPIHRITDLARNLAELAKDKNRQQNLFAYLVLESFDHVGRDLRPFLEQRYGKPEELTLSGNSMDGVAETFAMLKREESLPRSKLHQIIHQLNREPKKATSIINGVITSAGSHGYRPLQCLRNYFGRGNIGWFHIADLWDYVGV
jgi:hypothetical protein